MNRAGDDIFWSEVRACAEEGEVVTVVPPRARRPAKAKPSTSTTAAFEALREMMLEAKTEPERDRIAAVRIALTDVSRRLEQLQGDVRRAWGVSRGEIDPGAKRRAPR